MKKALVILTLVLALVLAVALTACNPPSDTKGSAGGGNGDDGNVSIGGGENGNKFDDIDTTEEIYAFSAASAGMLISAMNGGAAEALASSDAAAAADTALDDATKATLDEYMALVESLLGDGVFQSAAQESDRAEYDVKNTVSYKDAKGNTLNYVMYYNEYLLPDGDHDRDDRYDNETEEEYYIEGIMIIDGAEYGIRGEKSSESEDGEYEHETEFIVMLDNAANRYMLVEQSLETENGEEEQEYSYSIYEERRLSERSVVEYEQEGNETEIKLSYTANGRTENFYFDKEILHDGREITRVRIGSRQNSESYIVTAVTDADGNVSYEYSPYRSGRAAA